MDISELVNEFEEVDEVDAKIMDIKPSQAFESEEEKDNKNTDVVKNSAFFPLSDVSSDPVVNKHAVFLDKLSDLVELANETSTLSMRHELAFMLCMPGQEVI